MIKIFMKYLLFVSLLISSLAYAELGHLRGEVEYIRLHDAENPSWVPPVFWFTIKGVDSAGTCKEWHGRPIFVGNSSEMLSILLATQMSNKEIATYFDDTKLTNGYCRVGFVTTGNPPPTM